MTFKEFYKKEKYIVLHGQLVRFRIIKYAVLAVIFCSIYAWKGLTITVLSVLALAFAGICVHFFFRWMTVGWTRSWGLYKKIPLDN